jgi:hypothetical protein
LASVFARNPRIFVIRAAKPSRDKIAVGLSWAIGPNRSFFRDLQQDEDSRKDCFTHRPSGALDMTSP